MQVESKHLAKKVLTNEWLVLKFSSINILENLCVIQFFKYVYDIQFC